MGNLRTADRASWDVALEIAAAAVGASGLFFVLFGTAAASVFKRLTYGTAANPISNAEALNYTQFVYGVLGAVMVGWSVGLWFLIRGPLRRRDRWAWKAVSASIATWFIVDSTLSLVSGYGENAILNLAFAIMFGAPLLAIRRELHDAS